MLSAAVPQTWFAGSLLLYRLLQFHPSDRLKAVGPAPQPQSRILGCEYVELKPAASSRWNLTRFASLKWSLESVSLLGRIPDAWVDTAVGPFQPDIVVTVMERLDYVDAAHRFCVRRGIPLALISHDEIESFERVYPIFAPAQRRRIASIYRDAAVRFCVSPEMARRFDTIYGAPGTVLYPSRSDELTGRPASASETLAAAGRLSVGYTGAESYGYGQAVRTLMPALADLLTLRIYSRDAWNPLPPHTTHAGAFMANHELWDRVKAECDVVWLPYSYSPEMRSLYETHFPSKLTEYVALGMPVLITGPSYATGVKWGLRNSDAVVTVADGSVDEVRAAVQRLTADASLRARLSQQVVAAGNRDFEPATIRKVFYDSLERAVHREIG